MTRTHARWLLLMCAVSAPAGAQRHSFRFYAQQDGLMNLSLRTLLQDKTGFLWVGTSNGLFRYDGRRFTPFGKAEGLPSAYVSAIHQTPDGTLWVGTVSGLARLSGDRFETVLGGLILEDGIASDRRGRLLALAAGGVITVEPDPLRAGEYQVRGPHRPGGISGVSGIHVDAAGDLWFSCQPYLCLLGAGEVDVLFRGGAERARVEQWTQDRGVAADRWDSIRSAAGGDLWIRSRQRLMRLKKGGARFEDWSRGLPPANHRGQLNVDRSGKLWIATSGGLATRDGEGWRIVDRERGLDDSVRCVLEDREGSLWIGLGGAGLARWLGYGQWESWAESEGLRPAGVWSILRDAQERLWVGTDGGLFVQPRGASRFRLFSESAGLGRNRIVALATRPDGTLWAGSNTGGLVRIDPSGGRVEVVGPDAGLSNPGVASLATDPTGGLWVSTWDGLFRSHDGRSFAKVAVPGVGDPHFSSLAVDPKGRVWLCTRQGLLEWDGQKWSRYTAKDGLRSDSVRRLAAAPNGDIWVAYSEALGVTRLSRRQGQLQLDHFSMEQGLPSDKVYSLAVDANGRPWAGTDFGIGVAAGAAWRRLRRGDGLIWDDCNENALAAGADGALWVGTARGLSRFLPPAGFFSVEETSGPPAVITQVRFGSQQALGFAAIRRPGDPAPYGQGAFEAHFSALAFRLEDTIRFRYRLHDLEPGWTEVSRGEARYPNLQPGHYTFEVEARAADAAWSATPARFGFEVLPPWWRRAWFQLLAAVLAIWLARLYWTSRIRRLLDVQRRLEDAVDARTRELVDEKTLVVRQNQEIERLLREARRRERSKGQFLANMSHEVRTPLNGIMGMTELALETELPEKRKEYLQLARDAAHSLLTVVNDVLDFSKIEAGMLLLEIGEFQIRQHLEDVVRTMLPRASANGIALEWRVEDDVPRAVLGDPGRLRQILVNLVDNAIKFTPEGGVSIGVQAEAPAPASVTLHYSVADSGIGIPRDKQEIIFESFRQADESTTRRFGGTGLGLAISKDLVELMGGRIWVESVEGRGSVFHFTAVLQRPGAGAGGENEKSSERAEPPPPAALRILLAEDNAINQKLIVDMLERHGHRVKVVANGEQALGALDAETFDLVLMDTQMPVMGGLEATEALRQREKQTGRHVMVIAMSAGATEGDRQRWGRAGVDDYLPKPVRSTELLEKIAKAAATPR